MSLKIHKKAKKGIIVRQPTRRERLLKKVRNISIVAGVLILVLGSGGLLYTWYMGEHGKKTPASFASPQKAPKAPFVAPVTRAPNANLGASIQTITSPVNPGSNASVIIRTSPEADCTISVIYDKTASTDSGLVAKKADKYGVINWAWTVEPTVPVGKWPVKVTCELNKKSAVVQGDLVVELPKEE